MKPNPPQHNRAEPTPQPMNRPARDLHDPCERGMAPRPTAATEADQEDDA